MRKRITESALRRIIAESISEFKNKSTERFNTDPAYKEKVLRYGHMKDRNDAYLKDLFGHRYYSDNAWDDGEEERYPDVVKKWDERSENWPEGAWDTPYYEDERDAPEPTKYDKWYNDWYDANYPDGWDDEPDSYDDDEDALNETVRKVTKRVVRRCLAESRNRGRRNVRNRK